MPTPVSSSPFAEYAREHGFPRVTELPGSIGKNLSAKPKKIAPNSPMLEELAKFMKRPLSELQAFAKGPPMGDKWVKKIRGQIDKGTIPRGAASANKQTAAKQRPTSETRRRYKTSVAKNPLGRLIQSHGLTFAQLGDQIGIKTPVLWKASMGGLAPNHPVLPKIAEALGEPLGKIAGMQHGRKLKPGMRDKVARQLGIALSDTEKPDRKPGKGIVLGSLSSAPRDARGESNGSTGKHLVPRGAYGPQNRLASKRVQRDVRQSVRALVSTCNVAVMKGDSHIPPIPVEDMYAILQLLVTEMGIKVEVLIHPQFPKLFDPRS